MKGVSRIDVSMAVEEQQAGNRGAPAQGGSGGHSFLDRYDIRAEQPLARFDMPPAHAYACIPKRDSGREMFALVCDPKQPPRHHHVSALRRINQRGLLNVVEWEVIDWPLEGRRCPVIVYDRPQGTRVLDSLDGQIPKLSEEAVARNFIQPATAALRDIYNHGITHRAIRPTNLFFDSAAVGQATIMLGDCLSCSPGMNQPAVYETVESAMAPPTGRGLGSMSDDLYSFGVTILALLTGRSPCRGMSDDQVIEAKLTQGSYGAMIQRHRLSLTMMEVIRGLLIDDVEERWTLDDLDHWVSGRRLSPKQQAMPSRAARAFSFAGQELLTCRDVAYEFSKHWQPAVEQVRGGMLDVWLRRSLGDESAIEAVNMAKSVVSVTGTETDDRFLARILIALDPTGPIRFKSFAATIDGIGDHIAASYGDEEMRRDFAEALRANLVLFACEMMGKSGSDKMRYVAQFDKMKPFLNETAIGQGIERVIYELNPNLPCKSPLLEAEYVYDLTEMLHAYERLSEENPEGMTVLVDRHVAAFVACRLKGGLVGELRDLENRFDPAQVALANVSILAQVQDQAGSVPAPHLCNVAVRVLEPAVERLHSRARRDQVHKRLRAVAKDGVLAELLRTVNNTTMIDNDRNAYQRAVSEFVRLVLQMQRLAFEKTHRTQLSRVIGSEVSAFISFVLSLIAVIIMTIVWLI
jgi:hypothetical protein